MSFRPFIPVGHFPVTQTPYEYGKETLKRINVQIRAGNIDIRTYPLNEFLQALKRLKVMESSDVFYQDMLRISMDNIRLARDTIINYYAPIVRVDTGAMKSSFMKNVKIAKTFIDEYTVGYSIVFDLDNWLTEIPYAKFYVSELSQKGGNSQEGISITYIDRIMQDAIMKIERDLISRGYDLATMVRKVENETAILAMLKGSRLNMLGEL